MVARFVRVDVEAAGEGDLELSLALAMGLQPGPSSDPEAVIIGYAQQRPHVLLFDGCESHIDEAAGVADRLLVSCPQMRIVATSREPLGLAGETTVRVGSLDTDEARRLFCERAGFDATGLDETSAEQVATVCTALDGVPLAIELAAARLSSMPLPRLVELLDDQVDLLRRSRTFDPRHGSLATALEWSYQLLDEQQQRAFRMLAVFRSGFEIGAGSVVIDDRYGADIIDRLVEVSLIQPPDARGLYRMLEPIRQYARFVLDQSGEEDEARDRHARWIAERCNEIFEAEWTPQIFEGHAWVVVNRFELAAALQWSIQAAKPDIGISILASVGRRLANQGHGALVLPFALDIINHQAATPSRELAVAMAHTTHILHLALDHDAARALINRAETLATELDDPIALGTVLARKAAHLAEAKGGPRQEHLDMILHGMSLLEQAAGSAPIEYHNTSVMAANLGDIGLAEKYAHKLLAWEKAHHGPTTADADARLGAVSLLRGDLDQAIEHIRKAASGHKALLVQDRGHWVSLACLLTYADRYEEAVEALDTAVELGDLFGQDLTDLAAPRMRVAFAASDMNAVMTHAREWFAWALRTEGPLRQIVPDLSALLRGGPVAESEFLAVLLPLAQALMAGGDTEPACRFARAASALMAQTAFGAWDEIGETERWEQLADQCPQREHDEPIQMSLEEAFHEAARLVGVETRPSSP
ncbi:MAG: hypothetical protein IH942_07585 [Acidobacteria bacterium]|nr:hypothetical protein [Acidobacteriota bacterium]